MSQIVMYAILNFPLKSKTARIDAGGMGFYGNLFFFFGKPFSIRIERGLCTVGEVKFIENTTHIFCNGSLVYNQLICNLLIAQPAGDQFKGLEFARG